MSDESEESYDDIVRDAAAMKDLLVAASEATTSILESPTFLTSIPEQLQSDDPEACLLQLATYFRHRSALLLRQAKELEELALQQEEGETEGMEDMDDALYRKNVSYWVNKAYGVMEMSHDKLDLMENCLEPTSKHNSS